ncbi:MAG: hypothetical protein RSB67_00130 [Clostridia bacterium]
MRKIITIKFKKVLSLFIFSIILISLFLLTKENFGCVKESIDTFLSSIFPALFPFILFTEITLQTNILDNLSKVFGIITSKIFKVEKIATLSILLGFLCGFPMGAKAVSNLYEKKLISKRDASKLLTFVNNCNPAFILSTIGVGIFYNLKIGIILLISHYLSAIILGFLSCNNLIPFIIHENELKLNTFNTNKLKTVKKDTNYDFFYIVKISIINTFKTLLLILRLYNNI